MLKIDDCVKVRRGAERFWVIVAYIDEENVYAMVDNNCVTQPLFHGDIIFITEEEILDWC